MVKNNKNRGKKNFKRNPNEVTCLRCQTPGHYARDCTAPAPASASASGVSKQGASAFTTTSNGFAWMVSNSKLPISRNFY